MTNAEGEDGRRAAAPVVPLFRSLTQGARLFERAFQLDRDESTWPLARELYREVVRLMPLHVEAWNNLGVLAQRLGDKAEAMASWGRALEIEPQMAETHNNIGTLLQNERKFEVASVYLLRAVKYDPELEEARVNLALCLQALGRRKAALRQWRAYLEHHPSGEWATLAKKHERLCSAS